MHIMLKGKNSNFLHEEKKWDLEQIQKLHSFNFANNMGFIVKKHNPTHPTKTRLLEGKLITNWEHQKYVFGK